MKPRLRAQARRRVVAILAAAVFLAVRHERSRSRVLLRRVVPRRPCRVAGAALSRAGPGSTSGWRSPATRGPAPRRSSARSPSASGRASPKAAASRGVGSTGWVRTSWTAFRGDRRWEGLLRGGRVGDAGVFGCSTTSSSAAARQIPRRSRSARLNDRYGDAGRPPASSHSFLWRSPPQVSRRATARRRRPAGWQCRGRRRRNPVHAASDAGVRTTGRSSRSGRGGQVAVDRSDQVDGRRPTRISGANSRPNRAPTAAAEPRSRAPRPSPSRPTAARYRAAPATARATPGWPSVVSRCSEDRIDWPTRNAARSPAGTAPGPPARSRSPCPTAPAAWPGRRRSWSGSCRWRTRR